MSRYVDIKSRGSIKFDLDEKINENKSETSSKKSEVVPLPPPKQNGNLVTSDEHYSAHNKDGKNTGSSNTKNGRNNKAETTKNKGKRSDPEHQNRVQENIPRQSKSAPSENQKEQGTPRPQVNNFTKNLETDKTNGQTSVNKQDNDKRNKKNETTSPDVSKNYATHPELKTSQNTQSDAKSISSDKKGYTFKWKADPRKYTSPRTPRSKTPRSKTPRSKTPKFGAYRIKRNFGHRTRYTKSEPGDYRYDRNPRTPEPKRSILNNREAVKLEPNYSRPKSFKWERDKTIYRTQTRDWENERNELTYRPSVNSPTDWLKVYVGDIRIRETLKSSMSQRGSLGDDNDLSPNKASGVNGKPQREVILTRQQAKIYKNMHSVYGAGIANYKKTREKIFFDKLQDFHTFKTKLAMEDINEKQKKKQMSSRRQQIQLKELRQRFEDAAWVRFNTQYVTSRVLEHEKMNRYAYGLPEEVGGEPEYAAKLKRKSVKTNKDLEKVNKANKKKYGAMFKIYKGPEWERNAKTPPMEGIDTVVIEVEDPNEPRQMKDSEQNPETGNKKEVKRKVKNVIKEAKKEMEASKANSKSTGLTPRVDDNSNQKNNEIDLDDEDDDDDMSDIFERARKKYNLDIDEDEDALSRR